MDVRVLVGDGERRATFSATTARVRDVVATLFTAETAAGRGVRVIAGGRIVGPDTLLRTLRPVGVDDGSPLTLHAVVVAAPPPPEPNPEPAAAAAGGGAATWDDATARAASHAAAFHHPDAYVDVGSLRVHSVAAMQVALVALLAFAWWLLARGKATVAPLGWVILVIATVVVTLWVVATCPRWRWAARLQGEARPHRN